ncbi:MAG: HIT family protein [Atopostipes suicloacalis]|nr:HIT family protein [Atopostipes suicloacalis]
MTDCIFCMIRDGEIPSNKIYEDENVFVILDQSQVTPGHSLIIPKKHVPNIYDYDEDLAEKVFSVLPKISRALKNFHSDVKGLNVLVNNDEIASQTVFHSHIHLLPRYSEQDDFSLGWANNKDSYSNDQLEEIRQAISGELEEV